MTQLFFTYSASVFIEFDIVVEKDVLLFDRLSSKLERPMPWPRAVETHDDEGCSKSGQRRWNNDGRREMKLF
jgi:hypothetical protein